LYVVKVKQKGQVTLPAEIRDKMRIQEGSMLQLEEIEGGILLKPATPIKAGKVRGADVYKKVLSELDELRRNWR